MRQKPILSMVWVHKVDVSVEQLLRIIGEECVKVALLEQQVEQLRQQIEELKQLKNEQTISCSSDNPG